MYLRNNKIFNDFCMAIINSKFIYTHLVKKSKSMYGFCNGNARIAAGKYRDRYSNREFYPDYKVFVRDHKGYVEGKTLLISIAKYNFQTICFFKG